MRCFLVATSSGRRCSWRSIAVMYSSVRSAEMHVYGRCSLILTIIYVNNLVTVVYLQRYFIHILISVFVCVENGCVCEYKYKGHSINKLQK